MSASFEGNQSFPKRNKVKAGIAGCPSAIDDFKGIS